MNLANSPFGSAGRTPPFRLGRTFLNHAVFADTGQRCLIVQGYSATEGRKQC